MRYVCDRSSAPQCRTGWTIQTKVSKYTPVWSKLNTKIIIIWHFYQFHFWHSSYFIIILIFKLSFYSFSPTRHTFHGLQDRQNINNICMNTYKYIIIITLMLDICSYFFIIVFYSLFIIITIFFTIFKYNILIWPTSKMQVTQSSTRNNLQLVW